MIKSWAYDVEILPNFFSVTITSLNSYLDIFKDIVDTKGNPIPLVQKLTVKEIKERLNKVERHKFYITDTDDNQLLQMLGFFNNLRAHYDYTPDGKYVAIRNDVFGFNSMSYDKLMIACFLMFVDQVNNTKELITKLYETSKKIISLQDNKDLLNKDYYIQTLRKFGLPYNDIDIMRIFALNKVGKGVDSKGNTIYFGKSLKQTSINIQWYELLEYELPPISNKDVNLYYKKPEYKGLSADELNRLIEKWDRYIIDEWIEPTMHYNDNDVFIVCEIVRLKIDEIRLRYNITNSYGIDVLSSSRSNIADNMFIKFYSEFSGLQPFQWKGKKTERHAMSFNKVIFDFIKFKTPEMNQLLEEMKKTVVYSIGKKALKEVANKHPEFKYLKTNNESGWFEITINKLTYTIATGGLHSKDIPRELISKTVSSSTGKIIKSIAKDEVIWDMITDDSYVYCHYDIASFYPSIMVEYKIAPEHLNNGVFVKLIKWLRDTRVAAKHSTEPIIDGIPKGVLAEVLKIVINSIYGKLGFENGDLCDRLAVLKVTINGQLMVMMLCEELELNGIEVVSANTDGIVIKLYKKDKEKFDEIATRWLTNTRLGADSEEYRCYINRDINNYIIQELNGKIDYKGDLNPYMYIKSLDKGYDMPIVAKAVMNYFLENKNIMETLYECDNILDFCKSQNVGRQFNVEYTEGSERIQMQRYVRYYVTNRGGVIDKVHKDTGQRGGLCAGHEVKILNTLDDMPIAYRNINYGYYAKECYKIIDPIKLQISPNLKADSTKKTKSGKALIKQYSGQYATLFDDNEE